jgi:hypothetical protein
MLRTDYPMPYYDEICYCSDECESTASFEREAEIEAWEDTWADACADAEMDAYIDSVLDNDYDW